MFDNQTGNGSPDLNRRALLTTAGAVAALSLTGNRAFAQTVAPKILKYSDHEPLGGMRTRFLKDVLFPAIERESQGRLKVEDHWNGEIAQSYDALGIVGKSPKTDMATIVPEYTAKELPLHQIFKSFPMGPTGDAQVQLLRRIYREVPEFTDELAKNEIVNLHIGTGYPVAFFTTAPLGTLEGIVGGKWRSASFWHQDFLRNAKATPVSMPWGPEIYEALKKGDLDGLMVNVDSGYMLKIHEAAPHVLVSKDLWLGHVYLLAMKKSFWEGLAVEDQQALQRAAEQSYRTQGAVMDASFDAQIEDLKKAGAQVRVLSRAEAQAWQTATGYQEVQAAWAKSQQTKGVEGVETTLGKVGALMNAAMK